MGPSAGRLRLLFATTAGAGHFGPLEPFAAACVRAGHEVLVAGPPGAAPLAARAGLAFRAVGEASPAERARFTVGQAGLSPMEAMVRAVGELYVGLHANAALPGMLAALDEWRPDVVVRESAEFSSLVAAERLGVPHAQVNVGLSTGLPERMLVVAGSSLDVLGARAGLAHRWWQASPEPQLTLSPAALDGGPAAPGLVGRFRVPARLAEAASSLDGWGDPEQPLVYVSFGTEVPSPARPYFPELYRRVIDALAELPVRLLVTIGDRRDPSELGAVPSSVRVERWVPGAAALREAAVMVGHGGAGSVLGAFAAGVPMALIPLFADQPLNARSVAELGAGVVLDERADTAAAVAGILGEARFRAAARRVAEEIRDLPPVDEAVGALAALASGTRMRRSA